MLDTTSRRTFTQTKSMDNAPRNSTTWHVVRLQREGTATLTESAPAAYDYERRFVHTLVGAYEAAGCPPAFKVYQASNPSSLYNYLSPRAAEVAADVLEAEGFQLVPLRLGFDIEALPVGVLNQLALEARTDEVA